MSDGTAAHKLAQDLDAALAAYQRVYGRHRTMERLRLMLARGYEAQRIMDEAIASQGGQSTKAAE